ncbi:MAG: hypothetical protein AAFP13_02360 [Pseudomonadota bacterium]
MTFIEIAVPGAVVAYICIIIAYLEVSGRRLDRRIDAERKKRNTPAE